MSNEDVPIEQGSTVLSPSLRSSLDRLHESICSKKDREEKDARTVYEIAIPAQTLTVFGREHADHAVQTLRSLKVTGTYRVTRR